MSEKRLSDRPEVYALRKDSGNWQISRRNFLKAAGIGAATLGTGLNCRLAGPVSAEESTAEFCRKALAHEKKITSLYLSADEKYLLSRSDGPSYDDVIIKCWDMETGALVNSQTFNNPRRIRTAWIDGRSCLLVNSYKTIRIVSIPEMDVSDGITVTVDSGFKGNMINDFIVGPDEDLVVSLISNPNVIRIARTDDAAKYGSQSVVYTCRNNAPNYGGFLDENRLLVSTLLDFFILNVKDGTTETLNIPIKNIYTFYTLLSDKSRILVQDRVEEGADASYSLFSIEANTPVWRRSLPGREGKKVDIDLFVPTPDNSMAVLFTVDAGNIILRLISMEDGTVIREVDTGPDETNGASIVMAADGSKMAAALGKSIVFYSLPDLAVIGCPVDMSINPDDTEAVEVSDVDPVSGQTVTYTLPCGAAIPAGAVCICNCVAGGVPTVKPTAVPTKAPCSCVGFACSCVGNVCSCVGHTITTHYWHPN